MAFINWDSHYTVGIPTMDNQHKRMAEVVNQLHGDIRAGGDIARIRLLLDALQQVTVEHFTAEEELMIKINFPGQAKHADEHRELEKRLTEFAGRFAGEERASAADAQVFFRGWFLEHVQKHDRDYGVYLYNQRAKLRADITTPNSDKQKEPVG
jgi:hemerythrin